MKRSIRAVTTGSGTEPSSSTASWKADVEFETRSFPNLLVATLATLPSMSVIPSAPFAPSVFSMRRFVALLELGELLLRAGDVGLVRTAELKELPLATKV